MKLSSGDSQEIASLKGRVRELEDLLAVQKSAEERFRMLVDYAPYGIVVADSKGQIIQTNIQAEKMFGYSRDEFLLKQIEDLVPPGSRNRHPEHRKSFHAHPEPRSMGHGRDLRALRGDGSTFPVEIALTPFEDADRTLTLCSIVDITERKNLEAEIVHISENEQRRIGQDIHDDLCSQLSGIGCLTKVLEQQLSQHHKEESEAIGKITEMVSEAGTKAREIAHGLVPAVLENRGLAEAIREMARQKRELLGVNCIAKIANDADLTSLKKSNATQIYRIAQEAVNNAIKHSDADIIQIELQRDESGNFQLTVCDDGKGMPNDMVSAGLGLLTMRRRAEIIGAEFNIHTTPGSGTAIKCSLHPPPQGSHSNEEVSV